MGSQMWQYQMVAFAEQGFRCICFDRRGHGRSDQPSRGYDHDTFADEIATLIDDLDLTGLTLVGHSMASGEIVRYLSRHGDSRVARAILLGATTPMIRQANDNQTGIPTAQFEAVWAGWKLDYPRWVAEGTAPFFVPETSSAMIHGDRDRSAPLELTAGPSDRLLPNCRLIVYEGAPHGLIYTHMERLHRDILAFIAETKRDR
jgi:pimeloyl-ACP methyl ester carboxylesterase